MLTLALLLACSTPNTDGDSPAGKVTPDDLAELLDRVEQLEAEVVALRNAGAPVGIDADVDGDGLREWDGLPVGTRRGDVLYDWTCSAAGEVPPAAPGWMIEAWSAHSVDDRFPLPFGCWDDDGGSGRWSDKPPPGGDRWYMRFGPEDENVYRLQCAAI